MVTVSFMHQTLRLSSYKSSLNAFVLRSLALFMPLSSSCLFLIMLQFGILLLKVESPYPDNLTCFTFKFLLIAFY
jgi:hypothetical protein